MKPVCVKCKAEMRPQQNGIYIELLDTDGHPYQIWSGDKWRCPKCASEIVAGFGLKPIAEYFDSMRYRQFLADVEMSI